MVCLQSVLPLGKGEVEESETGDQRGVIVVKQTAHETKDM
jgi:hypothetical protein